MARTRSDPVREVQDRLRTTVTLPADVLEPVRQYMTRHQAKLQEALLALARLGAEEERRREHVRRLAAERRQAVSARRRTDRGTPLPAAEEVRQAALAGADDE